MAPGDGVSLVSGLCVLALSSLVASYLPARRAAKGPAGPGPARRVDGLGAATVRSNSAMKRALVACAAVLLALSALRGATRDDARGAGEAVPAERLLAAMREAQGYDLTATANGPRLQAEVLLRLIREADPGDPERRPLLVGHREWYEAFLRRTGLAPSAAPLYVRLPYEAGQDLVVDYRRETVMEAVVRGPQPLTVANVRISWPMGPGRRSQYSYDDERARPTLRVTQKRVIQYRLVDYGDRLWYAEVTGLHGRPTSGALGLLFDVIGEAAVRESRSAFLPDGMQIVRGRGAKWGLERTVTMTIWPDGHAEKGLPPDRPDLRDVEGRLTEPLEIRFRPLPPEP